MNPSFLIVDLNTGIVTSTEDEALVEELSQNSDDHTIIDLVNYGKPAYFSDDIMEFAEVDEHDSDNNDNVEQSDSDSTEEKKNED